VDLLEQKQDRGIGRPHRVEDIPREYDEVGPLDEHIVHRPAERLSDIGLALVPSPGRLPVVLAEPEVQVGEVGELHGQITPVAQ
jgi:hypothetical protein